MFAQTPALPPALEKLATTPVLPSELPPGFTRTKISRLGANVRLHTLGAVRIDFSNAHTTDSASYALLRTNAAAVRLARTEANANAHGLFHTKSVAIGRFAVGVAAATVAEANALLRLAVAHFRRAEG